MELISLSDLLTSSGSYPERANDPECTAEVKDNGVHLINKVNQLLEELGIEKATLSSGFRPSSVNSATPNAAQKSNHEIGKALDIIDDKNQTLAKKIVSRPDLLVKYQLWLEDPAHTIGQHTNWVHLDTGTRTDRPLRMFKL